MCAAMTRSSNWCCHHLTCKAGLRPPRPAATCSMLALTRARHKHVALIERPQLPVRGRAGACSTSSPTACDKPANSPDGAAVLALPERPPSATSVTPPEGWAAPTMCTAATRRHAAATVLTGTSEIHTQRNVAAFTNGGVLREAEPTSALLCGLAGDRACEQGPHRQRPLLGMLQRLPRTALKDTRTSPRRNPVPHAVDPQTRRLGVHPGDVSSRTPQRSTSQASRQASANLSDRGSTPGDAATPHQHLAERCTYYNRTPGPTGALKWAHGSDRPPSPA